MPFMPIWLCAPMVTETELSGELGARHSGFEGLRSRGNSTAVATIAAISPR
jgi:hypothetical protein